MTDGQVSLIQDSRDFHVTVEFDPGREVYIATCVEDPSATAEGKNEAEALHLVGEQLVQKVRESVSSGAVTGW